MDLYDAASFHSLVLATENKSPATSRMYLAYEKRFIAFCEAKSIAPDLVALNRANVRQWQVWMQRNATGSRGGASSRAQGATVLKVWAGFLVREGVLPADPLHGLGVPHVRAIERQPFSRTEVLALLQAADQGGRTALRDRLLLSLLLGTGARITEVTSLTVDRIRLLRDDRSIRVIGKGDRERICPIGDPTQPDGGALVRNLRAYLREREALFERRPARRTDRLFLSHSGYPLTSSGARGLLGVLGRRAGVANVHPHRARHTFATVYLERFPGDETGLRRILGHVSERVMRDYVHLSQAAVAERAGRANPMGAWLRGTA